MNKVVREKFCGLEKALQLQATEYKRRLKELNGEAGRLRSMQTNYIPREVFEKEVEILKRDIEILTASKLKAEGKGQWIQIVPWVLTIISLILMYLNYTKLH